MKFRILLILLLLLPFQASAKLIIKGNSRLSTPVILSYIMNKNYKAENIVKDLYQTGLFADIKSKTTNKDIIIDITENPIVSEVKIVGNDDIDNDTLLDELSLKKRSVFNKAKLGSDLKRINDIYIKSGRYLAEIEPKLIQ